MLKKITFELETITPMFISGANQSKAELRASSIKGLLRFWWRALHAEPDVDKLREKESKIFGSSDEGKGGSSFALRITYSGELRPTKDRFPSKQQYLVPVEGRNFNINILEYLAYGTYEYVRRQGNIFTREYYPPGTRFNVIVSFFDEQQKNKVMGAFYVWSLFGGIGSRSRNGYGSFHVLNMEQAFKDSKDLLLNLYEKDKLEKLVKERNIVSYPSFAQSVKIFRTNQLFDSALDALADLGKIYRKGRIQLENRHIFDKRQYIGAPIVERNETKSFLDRHAKPYFIKVAKKGDKYRAYILYLPSLYCKGLEEDRNSRRITNHAELDKRFDEVCKEFNEFLAQNMQTVI